jgi:hypothetical protein
MTYGLGTRSYNNSTEARENKKVRVPQSALERAEKKIADALKAKHPQAHVTLTRAEWSELWMADPANRKEYEVALFCRCPQRPYPHELFVHRLLKYESRYAISNEPVMKWPWTLRFLGDMEEAK